MTADHHHLLGLLALQTGLIDQAQLVAAFHAWTRDKSRPLADHLVALGHLSTAQRSVIEALAVLHVEAHGGDATASLAAVQVGKSTRESLAQLGDPDIEVALEHVGSGHGSTEDGDADRTASYAVGTSTSDGQRFRVLRPRARGGLGAIFVALDEELRRLLRRFLDVCNAIEYAHSRGVLHRDVKPGNVIVGRHGETLVVDWGLAKPTGRAEAAAPVERPLAPSSANGSAETLPGSALGTPAYMSPEQARGDLVALGPRSDVYSLGATLYCLMTGRPPFAGDDIGLVLGRVQRGDFAPPRRLDPSIDKALEAVCLRAMATRPEDRYANCRALADDVERCMADEPITAWHEPLLTRSRRWVRKHQTLATTAIALVMFGLAGLAIAYRREARYSAELGRANAKLSAANRESEFWLGETFKAFQDYYEDVGESVLRERSDLADLRRKLLDKPKIFYERIAAEYAKPRRDDARDRFLLARGQSNLGRILNMLGEDNKAVEQLQAAVSLFQKLVASDPDHLEYLDGLASGHMSLGQSLLGVGRMADAEEAFRKIVCGIRGIGCTPPRCRRVPLSTGPWPQQPGQFVSQARPFA
jgi:hypothetical protein